MTRKTKISILIITIYFMTFFLFELFIGSARAIESIEKSIELGMASILTPMVTFVEAGIWHFICVLIVAIVCRCMKKLINPINILYILFRLLLSFFQFLWGS